MSAPYEPNYRMRECAQRQCQGCGGDLLWIYTRRCGKKPSRIAQVQYRCNECQKITEYRPKPKKARELGVS